MGKACGRVSRIPVYKLLGTARGRLENSDMSVLVEANKLLRAVMRWCCFSVVPDVEKIADLALFSI